jgi:hypothetical protein
MKIQVNKITIDAEFTTKEELYALLQKVYKDYRDGIRECKRPFSQWIAHPKKERLDSGLQNTIGDLKGYKFEEIDGERFAVIESSINK